MDPYATYPSKFNVDFQTHRTSDYLDYVAAYQPHQQYHPTTKYSNSNGNQQRKLVIKTSLLF